MPVESGWTLTLRRGETDQTLVATLEDGSPDVKVDALACLGKHEDCIPLVLEQANSENKAVRAAALETLVRFGKVHIVCNNAGVAVTAPIGRMSEAEWDWQNAVNIMGVVHGVETFADDLPEVVECGLDPVVAAGAGAAVLAADIRVAPPIARDDRGARRLRGL